MKRQGQAFSERRALFVDALSSKGLLRWVLAVIALGLVAMIVDRHVTHPAGGWKIVLSCVFGVSIALADEIARARGKLFYSVSNVFYFAQYMLFNLAFIPEFSVSSPVIEILLCAAIFACGIVGAFVSTKDRAAFVVFDARDPLHRLFAALSVVMYAVFFVVAFWSRTWIVGIVSAAGVGLALGFPLCVISWLRQRARTAGSSGAGIQV
ncbi:MAG: hypothetical protein JWO85_3669 [Candidatus Eremiobacteraeota bacterium]|nr:hypothetical protein [Candidatus Eremiobacteraeota bacterium]